MRERLCYSKSEVKSFGKRVNPLVEKHWKMSTTKENVLENPSRHEDLMEKLNKHKEKFLKIFQEQNRLDRKKRRRLDDNTSEVSSKKREIRRKKSEVMPEKICQDETISIDDDEDNKTIIITDDENYEEKQQNEDLKEVNNKDFRKSIDETTGIETYELVDDDEEEERVADLIEKYQLKNLKPGSEKKLRPPVKLKKKQLSRAIDLLNARDNQLKRQKELDRVRRACQQQSNELAEISWDSPGCIIRHIRKAVMRNDWDALTHLLNLLLGCNKMYLPFLKEMTFLDVLMNKADFNSEALTEFLQLCFTRTEVEAEGFDVFYDEA